MRRTRQRRKGRVPTPRRPARRSSPRRAPGTRRPCRDLDLLDGQDITQHDVRWRLSGASNWSSDDQLSLSGDELASPDSATQSMTLPSATECVRMQHTCFTPETSYEVAVQVRNDAYRRRPQRAVPACTQRWHPLAIDGFEILREAHDAAGKLRWVLGDKFRW